MEAEIAHTGASPRRGRRYVLAAALLWSLGGVFAKSLDFDGLTIALYRGLFAGLALGLPFVARRKWVFRPALIPLGLCFGAMTGLYIAAIKATTAANAIYLQCTATFWTIPLSAWLLAERPDRRSVIGAGLATLGIVAIVLYGYDGRPDEWMGVAMGLASGLAYAGVVIGLRGLRGLDPAWLSAINNLLGAAALGTWLVLVRGGIVWPGVMPSLALLAFGIIQMAIPYVLFARGLREVGAPEASLIALLEPVLSPLWVYLATGERPADATFVGGLFLLSGVAFRYAPLPRRANPDEDIADPR